VFASLKKALKGHRFGMVEDVKAIMMLYIQQQLKEFLVEGTHWLVHQWDNCLSVHGGCFNSFYSFTQNSPQTSLEHTLIKFHEMCSAVLKLLMRADKWPDLLMKLIQVALDYLRAD
jgi:hypothetical protein